MIMNGQIYLQNVPELDKLTTKETYTLIDQYQENHDPMIKERLVIDNLKLVISMTKRFYQKSEFSQDLFQVGIIGLIKAIDHFDTSYQLQFSTYAVPLIIGEMKRFLRDNAPIRVSRTLKDLAYKVLKYKDEYITYHQKEPTIDQLAQHLHVSRNDIIDALLSTHHVSSLEDQLSNDEDDLKLVDSITLNPQQMQLYHSHLDLMNALNQLNVKQRKIINQRYFLGMSQSEIAREMNISQAQVSRIEKKAIELLHKMLN